MNMKSPSAAGPDMLLCWENVCSMLHLPFLTNGLCYYLYYTEVLMRRNRLYAFKKINCVLNYLSELETIAACDLLSLFIIWLYS